MHDCSCLRNNIDVRSQYGFFTNLDLLESCSCTFVHSPQPFTLLNLFTVIYLLQFYLAVSLDYIFS